MCNAKTTETATVWDDFYTSRTATLSKADKGQGQSS